MPTSPALSTPPHSISCPYIFTKPKLLMKYIMLFHVLPLYMEESIEMQSIGQSEEGLGDRLIRCLNALGKERKVKVAQLCLTLCDPMDHTVHGILQARILEWVAVPLSRRSPNRGIEHWSLSLQAASLPPWIKPRSPSLQADSLPAEPLGKTRNTGVGSLSLLQGSSQPRS